MIISEALSHLSKDDERIEVDENSPQHEREKDPLMCLNTSQKTEFTYKGRDTFKRGN